MALLLSLAVTDLVDCGPHRSTLVEYQVMPDAGLVDQHRFEVARSGELVVPGSNDVVAFNPVRPA